MSRRPHRWLAVPLAVVALMLGAAPAFAAHAVKVSPKNMHGWVFFDDNTGGPGSGQMVKGPGDPPLGIGSSQVGVTGPADRQALGTLAYQGTAVADLTALSYWTYQADPTHALTLQFDIHDAGAKYHRLVFEPGPGSGNAAILSNTWQRWSPLGGSWWVTHPNGVECTQATPCSWDRILANYPSASVSGATLFKAGGGWLPWSGNVDAFTIGTSSKHATTYNFEPARPSDDGNGDGRDGGGDNQGDNNDNLSSDN
jgi:hypothetical protein